MTGLQASEAELHMPSMHARGIAIFLLGVVLVTTAVTAAEDTGAAATGLSTEEARALVARVRPEVESIRGLVFKRDVDVTVVDDEISQRHMMRRLEKFGVLEDLEWDARALELLGLMPAGTDIMAAYRSFMREQAGGFYDPDSEAFFLLDDMPTALMPVLAAHELTHALEDQYHDLDARLQEYRDDDDRLFALSSVHEGSAMLVMTAYMTQAMVRGELDADELMRISEAEAGRMAKLAELPDALIRPALGAYVLGVGFLTRGNPLTAALGYPIDDVGRCFDGDGGPASSEQILHPEKYWDAERLDLPTEVRLDGAGRLLGRRWEMKTDGVLGELMIGPMVGAPTVRNLNSPAAMLGSSWTNEAAAGWDGDRIELWVRGDSAVALLGTVWDSTRDADEFVAALNGGDLAFKQCGTRVALLAGDAARRQARVLDRMLEAMGCEPQP